MLIAPSILDIDFTRLFDILEIFNKNGIKYIHLDIMDGVYVPNISFGIPIVKSIRKNFDFILDTHLMIVEPFKYIDKFIDAGSDIITFHYEATNHHNKIINSIREKGKQAGISINPSTPVNLLEEIIDDVDLVLLMSVNPGFGGQKFIETTYDKIDKIRNYYGNKKFILEADGGIDKETGLKLKAKGVDICVFGSYITCADDVELTLKDLINNLKEVK
jgi:ribulose-phosphate 3-epimerase